MESLYNLIAVVIGVLLTLFFTRRDKKNEAKEKICDLHTERLNKIDATVREHTNTIEEHHTAILNISNNCSRHIEKTNNIEGESAIFRTDIKNIYKTMEAINDNIQTIQEDIKNLLSKRV